MGRFDNMLDKIGRKHYVAFQVVFTLLPGVIVGGAILYFS